MSFIYPYKNNCINDVNNKDNGDYDGKRSENSTIKECRREDI